MRRRRRPFEVRHSGRSTGTDATNLRLVGTASKGVEGPTRRRGSITGRTSLLAPLPHHQHPDDRDDDDEDEGAQYHESDDDDPTLQTAAKGIVHVAGARPVRRRLEADAQFIAAHSEVVERRSVAAPPLHRLLHATEH